MQLRFNVVMTFFACQLVDGQCVDMFFNFETVMRADVRLVLRGKSSHQAVCLAKVQGLPGSNWTCRSNSGGRHGQPGS